jgi:hypothetical protein
MNTTIQNIYVVYQDLKSVVNNILTPPKPGKSNIPIKQPLLSSYQPLERADSVSIIKETYK